MINVFIVDDEPKVRKGLTAMLSNNPFKINITGLFESAEKALEAFSVNPPDLVITDIVMGKMDGLSFVSIIKEIAPDTEIIILSGYAEFEYAKQAIRYGVFRFLVKPMSRESLFQVISEVAEVINDRNAHERETAFQKIMRRTDYNVPAKVWNSFDFTRFRVFVVNIRPEYRNMNWNELFRVFLINRSEVVDFSIVRMYHDTFSIILSYRIGTSIESIARDMLCDFKMKGIINVGLSCEYSDRNDLATAYEQGYTALKSLLFQSTIDFAFYSSEMERKVQYPAALEEKLIKAIVVGDPEKAETALSEIQKFYKSSLPVYTIFEGHIKMICFALSRSMEAFGFNITDTHEFLLLTRNLSSCHTLEEIIQKLKTLVTSAVLSMAKLNERELSIKTKRMLEYIENNFKRDVSLTELGEHINMSPAYISQYFKNEMGINFTSYICKLRIEEAKRLLVSSSEKIVNVGRQCGFNDPKYFVTCFKKIVGVTPLEYRKHF